MGTFKSETALAFVLIVIVSSLVPAFAVVYVQSVYDPGVLVGQYVKYGNFVALPAPPMGLGWMKIEVTTVSGKEITLLASGVLQNGTAIPTSGTSTTYNVETGKMNQTTDYTYGVIIAGNLNEGDPVPPLDAGFKINKTETRTYNGVSRSVNIIETTYSDVNYENHWTLVYDKISGITLEFGFEVTQKGATPTTTKTGYSVTETNIFTSAQPTQTLEPTQSLIATPPSEETPSPELLQFALPTEVLIGVVIVIALVIVAAAILVLRKRRMQ